MKLLSLKVQNFLSYQDQEIDLADQGVVLISGANGTGKSALFVDAIPWCLYGQTIREKVFGSTNREWSKDDVVNREIQKDCFVTLIFEVDGTEYAVTRFRKHTSVGNELWLIDRSLEEDRILTGDTIKDTEAKLADLLDLNYSSFCNSLIFGQGSVKRFTQCTDLERRKILDDFLDLEIYTKAQRLVAADLVEARKAVASVGQKVYAAQQLAERAHEEHTEAVGRLNDFGGNSKAQVERLKAMLLETHTKKTSLQKNREDVEADLKAIRVVVEESLNVWMSAEKASQLEEKLKEVQVDEYQLAARVKNVKHRVGGLEVDLKRFSPGDECFACKQALNEEQIEDYRLGVLKELEIEQNSFLEMVEKLGKLRRELDKLEGIKEVDVERKEIHIQAKHKEAKVERELHQVEKQLADVKYTHLEAQSRLDQMDQERKRLQERVDETKADVLNLVGVLQGLTKENVGAQKQEGQLKFWSDGFGHHGIKDLCFDRSLGYLNSQLTEYSRWLTDGQIGIQLERDEAGKRIEARIDIDKAADSYILSSQGQARRIDLCLALAFQSLVGVQHQDQNVLVFDEFTDGLDAEGINKFIQFLHHQALTKSVFVISHNPEVQQHFEKVWEIEYENGVSHVECG